MNHQTQKAVAKAIREADEESMGLRVIVCGGRHYFDRVRVFVTLHDLHHARNFSVLIHGACTGADSLARSWALSRGIPMLPFPADWYPDGKLDKSAGPRRNQQMIDEGKPDLVVAFPGDKGTADMVRRAKVAGIEVREVAP